jgi:hypothetical protein
MLDIEALDLHAQIRVQGSKFKCHCQTPATGSYNARPTSRIIYII